MENRNNVKKWDQFLNENVNGVGIKLGDKIIRGDVNSIGLVVDYPKNDLREYRVVGLNPNLKLQEILIVNGEEELGDVEEFDWSVTKFLRPMFPKNHIIYSISDIDWSYIWVGNF